MAAQSFGTFGTLLKRHRDAAGLTQAELADRAMVGVRTISDLERGVSKSPYPSTIRRLSQALSLPAVDGAEFAASARRPMTRSSQGTRPGVKGSFLGAIPTTRIVSRAEEVGRVLDALEAAESGSGRLVLLSGEPGIGKTRLAQEASVHARERGFLVATGRCYEAQSGIAYYPFLDATFLRLRSPRGPGPGVPMLRADPACATRRTSGAPRGRPRQAGTVRHEPGAIRDPLTLTVLAEAYADTGQLAEAEEIVDLAVTRADLMQNLVVGLEASCVHGRILAANGHYEQANATLEESPSMARSMPCPYAEGIVLRDLGTLLGAAREKASERLSSALVIFRRLGAWEEARETGRALGATGIASV